MAPTGSPGAERGDNLSGRASQVKTSAVPIPCSLVGCTEIALATSNQAATFRPTGMPAFAHSPTR